jgi:3-methyladenine DNA glycosylase AlkD
VDFVGVVRASLRAAADPARAPGMEAYMESAMPFLGVQAPALQRICRETLKAAPPDDWRDAVLLWREADREFFVRKAVGWALREYSKSDGDWVRRYVREREDRLSPLSRREALKWLEHVHVPR